MKKLVLVLSIIVCSTMLFAQPTPPAGGSYTHGSGGNQQPGGGAPIDGGFSILLALGAIYAGKKLYGIRNKNEE
jgi:hypothetical protein